MRFLVAAAFASVGACTLLDSRDELVGPPLGDDAGLDATSPVDGSTGLLDGGDATGPVGADGPLETMPFDATQPDSPADSPGPVDAGPAAIYAQRISPLGVAVHAGTICWVEGDSTRMIACAPAAGGSASQVTTVASQTSDSLVDDAFDVALDDTYLYWSNGPKNQVLRRALAGGTSAQYFTGDQQLSYIVLDGTNLWATDYVAGSAGGNIVVGPSGTSSQLVYPGETQAAGIGVYSGSVYWGRASPSSVSLGPESGNMTVTRVPAAARVTGLALDASGTAYFLTGNQQVFRLQQGSSMPEMLYDAGASFGDSDLAVDDGAIYWTEHDLGQIWRMAK